MNLPEFSMRQLLDAGIHFGHQSHRWNPKMKPYLYGVRNGIHIIDLQQTVPMLYNAMNFLLDIASNGGRILFVGTKRQAQDPIKDSATRSGQYFVNNRWLGGMLTNWETISKSIKLLKDLEKKLSVENIGLTKKETLGLQRRKNKLDLSLGGIKDMGGVPDTIVVFDTNKEKNALAEAKVLGIPIVAIIDSNSDPEGIDYPIPGNDDATRAIVTFCNLMSESIIMGLKESFKGSASDIGESDLLVEEMLNKKIPNNIDNAKTNSEVKAPEVVKVNSSTTHSEIKAPEAEKVNSSEDIKEN